MTVMFGQASINPNLWQVTAGEKLWLWRRCRGDTQQEAADRLGMCRTTLHRMEHDQRPAYNGYMPPAALPTVGVWCALARRRTRLGLHEVARAMGISHVTVLQRELAGAPELVEFWRNQGFRFPAG